MCKCAKKSKRQTEVKYVKYVGFDDCNYCFRELMCAKTSCENGGCSIKYNNLKIRKTSFIDPIFQINTYYELRPEITTFGLNNCNCKTDNVIYTVTPLEEYFLNRGSPQLLISCEDTCSNLNAPISGIRGARYNSLGQAQSFQDTLFVNLCSTYENCECKFFGIRYLRITAQVVCNINVDYGFVLCHTESCDINNSEIITPLFT